MSNLSKHLAMMTDYWLLYYRLGIRCCSISLHIARIDITMQPFEKEPAEESWRETLERKKSLANSAVSVFNYLDIGIKLF